MKLVFAGTTIFDDSALIYASGLTINGVASVQRDELLRAANARFHDRGNKFLDIRFSVTRSHASLREAQEFAFTHPLLVAGKGSAVLTLGLTGDSSTATGADSILTCSATANGVKTVCSYSLQAPAFVIS